MVGLSTSSLGLKLQFGLSQANRAIDASLERLATGKQINRAADDPSGLIASERINTDLVKARKTMDALERTNIFLGARDGALSAIGDLAIQLQGIVTTAANVSGNSEAERQALNDEARSIIKTIDFLNQTQTFQDQKVLSGSSAADLGLLDLDLLAEDLEGAQAAVDAAVENISTKRATIGNQINSNQSKIRVLIEEEESLLGAYGDIVDTDYAKEVSELVRNQILRDANAQLFDIERQQAQVALTLLEGAMNTNR